MELFDLVNEKDEVIGVTTKLESHTNRELHRIVAINVFDNEGRVYLQEHVKSGGIYDHSIGGHVKKGESYEEAAKREALEELGLEGKFEEIAVFYPHDLILGKKGMHMIAFYEITPSNSWQFIPNEEVNSILPFHLEEVVSMINKNPEKFTTDFIRTMKKYLEVKSIPLKINY